MERLKVLLFTLRSLTFNSGTSRAAVLDTIFEPVFWIVDHFVGILGPVSSFLIKQIMNTDRSTITGFGVVEGMDWGFGIEAGGRG